MENKAGLGDRHLQLFGTIIQRFAAHELLMQRIMAHLLSTKPASVMLLTRHLPFEGKHRALLDLLRHRKIPHDQIDRVSAYLSVPLELARLRNDIVHSVWMPAREPDTIQPAWILEPLARIKPVHTETNVAPGAFIEDDEEKFGYSLDDLTDIAAALENNRATFAAYLANAGLVDEF